MQPDQRFLRVDRRELSPDDEMLELAEALSGAPGVSAVEVQGAHPKGGYGVRLDLASQATEAFILCLEGRDWRPVM